MADVKLKLETLAGLVTAGEEIYRLVGSDLSPGMFRDRFEKFSLDEKWRYLRAVESMRHCAGILAASNVTLNAGK